MVATMVYFAIVGNPALFWLSDWVDRTLLPHKWLVLSLWTAPFVAGLHAVSRRELRLWRQAAADLGLEVPRVEGRLQWAMLLLWPTSKQVYDLLPPMQGEMRGVRVRVAAETALTREHEGNSIRKVETVVTASLTRHPDVALDVTETGIVSLDDLRERVGLPPEDAHETGDAAFDDRFDVRLSTPADVEPSWVLSSGVPARGRPPHGTHRRRRRGHPSPGGSRVRPRDPQATDGGSHRTRDRHRPDRRNRHVNYPTLTLAHARV